MRLKVLFMILSLQRITVSTLKVKFSAKMPLSFQKNGVQMEKGGTYWAVGAAALIPACTTH